MSWYAMDDYELLLKCVGDYRQEIVTRYNMSGFGINPLYRDRLQELDSLIEKLNNNEPEFRALLEK